MLVLKRELFNLCFLNALARRYHIDVSGSGEALASCQDTLAIVGELQTRPVSPVLSELFHFVFLCNAIHIDTTVPYAEEKELSLLVFLWCPAEGINI